jgi:hypothetical protein
MKKVFLFVFFVMTPTWSLAKVDSETCAPFYQALASIPHESIFQRDGLYNSRWFEVGVSGCFLIMNSSESRLGGQALPDLSGEPGTPLYKKGWRINPTYSADGPGAAVTGLERDDALCLIYSEQPTYINDDGRMAKDVFIKIRVECTERLRDGEPRFILREAK